MVATSNEGSTKSQAARSARVFAAEYAAAPGVSFFAASS